MHTLCPYIGIVIKFCATQKKILCCPFCKQEKNRTSCKIHLQFITSFENLNAFQPTAACIKYLPVNIVEIFPKCKINIIKILISNQISRNCVKMTDLLLS